MAGVEFHEDACFICLERKDWIEAGQTEPAEIQQLICGPEAHDDYVFLDVGVLLIQQLERLVHFGQLKFENPPRNVRQVF